MTLYRAIYQPHQCGKKLRGMTFAAPDAAAATRIADDWQLPGDVLLTVKPLRKLTEQFTLEGA